MDHTLHQASGRDGLHTYGVAPKIIDLNNIDTDVDWESHHLSGSSSLYWDRGSKAFFRLQVSVTVITTTGLQKDKYPLFLIIPPERIQQLSFGQSPGVNGLETQTLDFVLNRPPFRIVSNQSLTPKDNVSEMTADMFYILASQSKFTLRMKIPERVLFDDDWHAFCAAASGGALSMANDRADLKKYYRGGCTIVEGDIRLDTSAGTTFQNQSASPAAPAPSYSGPLPVVDAIPAPGYSGLSPTIYPAPTYTKTPAVLGKTPCSKNFNPQY